MSLVSWKQSVVTCTYRQMNAFPYFRINRFELLPMHWISLCQTRAWIQRCFGALESTPSCHICFWVHEFMEISESKPILYVQMNLSWKSTRLVCVFEIKCSKPCECWTTKSVGSTQSILTKAKHFFGKIAIECI